MKKIPLWLAGVLVAIASFGIALGLRFLLIEPPHFAWVCQAAAPPWWCPLRAGAILFLRAQGLGLIALGAGLLAMWRGSTPAALIAVACGTAGLVLYGPEASAGGVLLGAVAVARRSGAPAAAS